ncbi:MAG: hypothetical protein WD872_16100 [Pirellulaceae bacterium]
MAKKSKAAARSRVPVSRRAVLQRVNRKLAPQSEMLKAWRRSGAENYATYEPGDLYHLDFSRNLMLHVNVDLEAMARDLGALAEWETITE